ncbi:hypothetical protein L1987_65374 [Smallanthus sonchifolius]|uniref:Uncharacterized protein n=1 Tax=Smallanthus sonchifolius TaxID=185202 RepID=A0ACB9BUA3_9ASTR|nr:hypothetical protein L1987_65374 [Smallanthus sonchifolius]
MGACLSSTSSIDKTTSCAFVVSAKGELIHYPTPIFVSELLQPSSFVCDSDTLYLDHPIPALDPEHQLEPGQIYFVLQKTMLHRRLSTSDMAALALKASVALDSDHHKRNKNKARISPSLGHEEGDEKTRYSSKKARLATIYEGCDE